MSDDASSWPAPLDDGRPAGQQIRDLLDERKLRDVRAALREHIGMPQMHRQFTDEQHRVLLLLVEERLFTRKAAKIAAWGLALFAGAASLVQAWDTLAKSMPWGR